MVQVWTDWLHETARFLAGSLGIAFLFLLLSLPGLVAIWILRRWFKATAEEVHKELGREEQEGRWHRHRMRQYAGISKRVRHHH